MERRYVTVVAKITPEGDLFPLRLCFDDGSEFTISRRLQAPQRNLAKDGSSDWRFSCLIEDRPVTLFYDAASHRWSIEASLLSGGLQE
ncbi:MAG TPA: hypothetical protein PK646_03735 [Bacillota bacterium]|jgi:hypothetical protein|nr:hypothetical protein [Fastidiosipila sp.]HPX93411.1 hypothetical protein [Bacillota bacterium]HQB81183.1 hypothetical protein [Bacillota bacterium]